MIRNSFRLCALLHEIVLDLGGLWRGFVFIEKLKTQIKTECEILVENNRVANAININARTNFLSFLSKTNNKTKKKKTQT